MMIYERLDCQNYNIQLIFNTAFISSRPDVFCKKVLLKILPNSQENTCTRDFLPGPATLLKKSLWHRCFPVNFAKFLRAPFLCNTSGGCFYAFQWMID